MDDRLKEAEAIIKTAELLSEFFYDQEEETPNGLAESVGVLARRYMLKHNMSGSGKRALAPKWNE